MRKRKLPEIHVDGYRLRTEHEVSLFRALNRLAETKARDGTPKLPLDEPALRELFEHINGLEATPRELEELRAHFAQGAKSKLLLKPESMKNQTESALSAIRRAKKPLPGHGRDISDRHRWWRK